MCHKLNLLKRYLYKFVEKGNKIYSCCKKKRISNVIINVITNFIIINVYIWEENVKIVKKQYESDITAVKKEKLHEKDIHKNIKNRAKCIENKIKSI